MLNYRLFRPILFTFNPEFAHHLGFKGLKILDYFNLINKLVITSDLPKKPKIVFGLNFENSLGLAAGLDKDGECIKELASLGFGCLELGAVTPLPQPGNPKPRLFRLPEHQAIINRMGFNNLGVDNLVSRLEKFRNFESKKTSPSKTSPIIGVNIGKNLSTPIESSNQDYLICYEKLYPLADYISVNISSPNTTNLRFLQFGEALRSLLSSLKNKQLNLTTKHKKRCPLILKISPDLEPKELEEICNVTVDFGFDGLCLTNTTTKRNGVENSPNSSEKGGLSGLPLKDVSRKMLLDAKQIIGNKIPLISVGGIMDAEEAALRMESGADLIQIYTGFVYSGPKIIEDILARI